MKKTIYLKSIFLLCLLLAGAVSAHADGYDYDYVKVTSLDDVAGGETVLLVDQSKNLALSPLNGPYGIGLKGVDVAIGEDNVVRNVSADMIWTIGNKSGNSFTFNNNGKPLNGSLSSSSVSVTNEPYGENTNEFFLDEYGDNGGKLYYMGNTNEKAYFIWNSDNEITIDSETQARFTLYKVTIKNYVKWKRVDGLYGTSQNLKVPLKQNDIVVVVDLKTGKAMSNDKGEKDPAGVAVTLNYDKDRIIMDEVPENVQWKYQYNSGNTLVTLDETPQQLYTDADKGLKVGNITEATNPISTFTFIKTDNAFFPAFVIDETDYQPNFDDGMFSNSWTLEKVADYDGEGIAIFKKVEDRQKIAKIEMAEYYNLYRDAIDYADLNASITGAEFSEINWDSSKPGVATAATVTDEETHRTYGKVTGYQRGSTVITASVIETNYHDKASAKSTVIVDETQSTVPGSLQNPLTVAQAKQLIESENKTITIDGQTVTWAEGVRYYIKGKVSKVNSGMMAMFGDMDFGEMMGGNSSGSSSFNFEDSMDDMDFDKEDMEESGFDMSSMGFDMSSMGFDMSAMFGTSDKVTYYISDDGTKDGQMKVINGCGTLNSDGSTAMEFDSIPKLSPGDCVVVCGPLVYTEDTNMFSSMMGGNKDEQPKMSGKVDEMNYLAVYDPTLLITEPEPKEIFVNKTLDGSKEAETPLYTIDELFNRFNEDKFPEGAEIQPATYKSSDEDIAKWDEETNIITGVNEGKAKITVKVKVVLPKREGDDEDKERSYTMKRKFKVIVKTRDLDPAGYYDGEWVLTTQEEASELKEGTRLVLVGTRVKDDKATDYMMVENNAMMGGGKNGSKIEFNEPTIPSSTVTSKKGLEVILEKDKVNESLWMLKVGINEENEPLYLYATYAPEEEQQQDPEEEEDEQEGNKFDMKKMMEMFSPSSGMKVGTIDEANQDAQDNDVNVSLKATINFTGNIATIKFDGIPDDYNNTIMLSSSFDMEEMMGMFGGMGNKEEETTTEDDTTEDDDNNEKSTFDMGSFDMFMASFNTKKPGDEQEQTGEDGETKAPKCFMPRIYRFKPDESFNITFDTNKNGTTEWRTIVTYKDVQVPNNVEAYIVKKVTPEYDKSVASLWPVKQLKGGEPYLLHTSQPNSYAMTLLTPYEPDKLEAPKGNLLRKSDRKTIGTKTSSTVYVLANKTKGYGFYRWTGDELGAGRVYLPVEALVNGAGAHEYCGFFVNETSEATAIESIDDFKANVGPFYDLQGRRVDNPTKGIYIVNGKKVIVK